MDIILIKNTLPYEEAYSGPSHQGLNKLELPMVVAIRNVMLVTMASQNKVVPENKRRSVV